MSDPAAAWTEVAHCISGAECQEYSLVLTALGLAHQVRTGEETDAAMVLLVPSAHAARARAELEDYARERQTWPPPERPVSPLNLRLGDVTGYWLVLLSCHVLRQHHVFSRDWLALGRSEAGRVQAGEWWRTVTALTLHADGPHLFNNLLFGSLFGLLLGPQLGRGVTWFSVLLAGVAGNAANALARAPEHASVGASTGVFGAAGLLMVLQWRHHRQQPQPLRRWTPLIIGMVLLGLLGTSGARTDVMAHVGGMIAGLGLGLVLAVLPALSARASWTQGALLWLAGFVVAACWWVALQG